MKRMINSPMMAPSPSIPKFSSFPVDTLSLVDKVINQQHLLEVCDVVVFDLLSL